MKQRSTFREKCPSVCWQKQLRDEFLSQGTPPVPHLDVGRAIVRPVTRKFAEQIILKYEWLGTMSSTSEHFGIFFGNYCAGVCCVAMNGIGTGGTLAHAPFQVTRRELAMLARGACTHWAPSSSNSKLIAWTCRLLAIRRPGVRAVIAYSDLDAGEIGTVYQACGWIYVGKTNRVEQFVSPSGRVYDRRFMTANAKKRDISCGAMRQILSDRGWIEQLGSSKHKYVKVLRKNDHVLIEHVKKMILPYPKRASEGGDGGNHPHSGGAAPTSTLQTTETGKQPLPVADH